MSELEPPMMLEARLRTEIAQKIAAAAPVGWTAIDLEVMALGRLRELHTSITIQSGDVIREDGIGGVSLEVRDLRKGMYEAGRGAWTVMRLRITAAGTSEATYSYDEHPVFAFGVGAAEYATEQQRFPRDPDHRPTWLQEKLTEAGVHE